MTTTNDILQYKREIREAEIKECLRRVGDAAERVSGNREKHHGAMECVQELANYLKEFLEA